MKRLIGETIDRKYDGERWRMFRDKAKVQAAADIRGLKLAGKRPD
jgi:hypothetical protein